MNSRQRMLTTLNHRRPDRVPFDLGGTQQSGIHRQAYLNLRRYLGLPEIEPQVQTLVIQSARLDQDFRERLNIDTYFVNRYLTTGEPIQFRDAGDYIEFTDDWGCERRKPKKNGLYYDIWQHPFDVENLVERLKDYSWPDPTHPGRFTGLRAEAQQARDQGKLVVLGAHCAGIFETAWFLRGMERFFLDLALDPPAAEFFLDKVLELKIAFWEKALAELGDLVDVVNEADDVAGQEGLLMSPEMYRRFIKPRQQELFTRMKQAAPHVKLFFHTCGAIRPLIPDLIEIGIDILNPVQITATGMDPVALKQAFGREICFWGGGVDTQNVLCQGTPDEVRTHVRRNIEAFAPGGGFVFAAVHIVQADVLPQNFMAMWETLQEYGHYP